MSMIAVLDQILNLLSTGASGVSFGVEATKCTPESCPGSFYTAIATAWANIGYMTHSDVLHFLNTTNFSKWAIILYIAAAITGLLGVATNAPMKNYTWFFIGPALYSFLVGTTMEVQGVNWVVANVAQENMAEVWKNAETGLANTKLARDLNRGVKINGRDGPSGMYEVAMPMVFLDELFSATANILVEWTGVGAQVGGSGQKTNLANNQSKPEGPWWLLSTLKYGFIENITSNTARNPDVRDALVTFLGSECGEKFKEGINSGAYIAATQARGATPVTSVMIGGGSNNYKQFIEGLNNVAIPAPRSLARLFKEGKSLQFTAVNTDDNFMGPPSPNPDTDESDIYFRDPSNPNFIAPSFLNFSERLAFAGGRGRGHGIVCSEYLWTIIQALRYEAGHAYYQLIRSTPTGLNEQEFVNTLIYGWDVRKKPESKIANADEQEAFLKHLILAYIVRNELLFAPQITSVDQRFAPSEQSKSYSDAYVRSYGSKAKFIELYNAAIMMPHLQGILAYFLLVSYPIACMLVILPGHYKGFLTWVSFFAWIKIWDVGFAMVQVIERSVWAMVGNHKHMAATANVLIETAEKVGGIGVTNPVGMGMGNGGGVLLPSVRDAQAAVPLVCSLAGLNGECADNKAGAHQSLEKAVELFDKLLLTSANIDLDLSNGWYIYIMSALYLAVPAVTGQLVLGAKAGSASMIKDAWSGVANDGSNAAKTGAQHKDVAAATTNASSLGQAAYAKAMRAPQRNKDGSMGSSLAMQSFGAMNDSMDMGRESRGKQLTGQALNGAHSVAGMVRGSFNNASQMVAGGQKVLQDGVNGLIDAKSGGGGGGGGSKRGAVGSAAGIVNNGAANVNSAFQAAGNVALGRAEHQRGVAALAAGQNLGWQGAALDVNSNGMRDYGGKLGSQAEFEAQSAAWEARNEFASHAAASAGIAGMNAGNIAPGQKPQDRDGMAMSGMFDGFSANMDRTASAVAGQSASSAASYSGTTFQAGTTAWRDNGIANYGAARVAQPWIQNGGAFSAGGAEKFGVAQGLPGNHNWVHSEGDNSYNIHSPQNTVAESDATVTEVRGMIDNGIRATGTTNNQSGQVDPREKKNP